MIERLTIRNFKAFDAMEIRLRALTVLTGLNNTGKSSTIQSLLLARLATVSSGRVALNGGYGLLLGEALDVLHADANEQVITLQILTSLGPEEVKLGVPNDRAVALDLLEGGYKISHEGPSELKIREYLSAERLGPRDLLEIGNDSDEYLSVGERGQYTAHVMALTEREAVRQSLLHPETETKSLAVTKGEQVQAWLSSIVSPVRVQANWLPQTNAATVRFRDPEILSEWARPANVGFGLSYSLPVVVAALNCDPGSIFIVENPEAHLHPAGQSMIGRFLGRVAASGVQVIVETHSDHVVNGMRLSVASDGILAPEDVIIHFFGGLSQHSEISVGDSGSLTSWPHQFFDQTERDLGELSQARHRG